VQSVWRMVPAKILILGSRGTVGSAIAAAAGERAVCAARLPAGAGTLVFDALADDVAQLLERTRPQAVVLAFGISGTHTCASIPRDSRFLNVDRTLAIAKAVARSGALPVLLSTDCVFDGSPVIWSEQDATAPICEYGRQKRDAEDAVAALGVQYLLLRLSRVIADHSCRRDLLYQWCGLIHARKPVQLAANQCFRPIAAADLGRIAVELIDRQTRGLIHVAGSETITSPGLFELLYECIRQHGIHVPVEREICRVEDLPGLELRPASTLLSIERLEQLIKPCFTPLDNVVRTVAERAFALGSRHRYADAIAS
jgi:dTDP-4-dehydrorhamnose reductase